MNRLVQSGFIAIICAGLGACTAIPRVYPVCNLKCSSGEECSSVHSVTEREIEHIISTLQDSYVIGRTELVSLTFGYAVLLTTEKSDEKLRDAWLATGCFTSQFPSSGVDYARFQQCTQGMRDWLILSSPGQTKDLLLDSRFRQTCLRSSD